MKIRFVSAYPKGIQDVGDSVPSVGLGTKTWYQYGTSNYVTGSRSRKVLEKLCLFRG